MKYPAIMFGLLVCSGGAAAQQTATVQMQCHDLSTNGNFLGSDEVLVNGMACRTVKSAPSTPSQITQVSAVSPVATPTAVPAKQVTSLDAPAPAQPAAAPGEPSTTPEATTTENGQVLPGSRIVIAPMGGFETYFAAAMREKKVPVRLTLDRDSAQYFIVSTETEWHGFVYGSAGGANWNQNGGSAGHAASASSTRGLEASIMLIDAKSKDVVWAYEVHKSSHGALLLGTHASRGQQSLAEACAKHLKEFIEKGK
jgi:hypothetical protein